MSKIKGRLFLTGAIAVAIAIPTLSVSEPLGAVAPTANAVLELVPLGTYIGSGGLGASEIAAFDSLTKQIYITNGATNKINIVSIANPLAPVLVANVDLSSYGVGVQSVAVGNGIVAAAVDSSPTTDSTGRRTATDGRVVLMSTDGQVLKSLTVGNLPDHVSFTPDKKTILVANEGEPICALENTATAALEAEDPTLVSDPKGTISLIDVTNGAANATVKTLDFSGFNKTDLLAKNVRVFFPGSSAEQDLEPEYITTNASGTQAYVTLQEANAVAIVDLAAKTITDVVSLGYKDWGAAGLVYDGSKTDSTSSKTLANPISYAGVPLKGMYMPDTIASYSVSGQTYLVTANEGDTRDYTCYKEESTFGDISGIDSFAAYWDTANDAVKANAKLGAQKTTLAFPTKAPVSGTTTNLYTFGGRSFTIRKADGTLVWDSGSEFEEIALRDYPKAFNSDSDSGAASSLLMVQGQPARLDGRSTSKGVEPEALAVGTIGTQTFAFIGLERMGGIMAYNISNPATPTFISYTNLALAGLGLSPANNTTPGSYDVSPEAIVFVPAVQSPTLKPLLITANELSGTTTVYEVRVASPTTVPNVAPAKETLDALKEKTLLTTTATPAAGASITATSNGFVPFETVQLIVDSSSIVATATADALGSATISGALSSTISLGSHVVAMFAPVSGIGYKTSMTVVSVANKPSISVVTATSGKLSVAFKAPSSNGGSSITNYEYSTNNGRAWKALSPAVTTTPLVITERSDTTGKLVNGTTYKVKIRAVSAAGSGAASAMKSGKPIPVADAPTIGVVTATSGKLSVAFTAPSSNGGSLITNYEYSTNNGTIWKAFSPADTSSPLEIKRSVTTGSLLKGSVYRVMIRAVNATGSGAPSVAKSVKAK